MIAKLKASLFSNTSIFTMEGVRMIVELDRTMSPMTNRLGTLNCYMISFPGEPSRNSGLA